MQKITIHTDGGSLNNPGQAGIGFVIYDNESKILYEKGEAIGIATNNVAEYTALIRALTYVRDFILNEVESLIIKADSELMIKQLKNEYKVKNQDLKTLYNEVLLLVQEINLPITYIHVYREQNVLADSLVKKSLGR